MSTEDNQENIDTTYTDDQNGPPMRLRRAETVLRNRTSRMILVLERCLDSHNHQAVIRTAEALGIQHIWTVSPPVDTTQQNRRHKLAKKITKGCFKWLSIRNFNSISNCIAALQESKYEIWSIDTSENAIVLSNENKHNFLPLPPKIAIVIGREIDGVSQEMLAVSSKRMSLQNFGFTPGFQISVSTALILQRMFDWFPEIRGDIENEEAQRLREVWFDELAVNPTALKKYSYWKDHFQQLEVMDDLRREEACPWIPPKIRKREQLTEENTKKKKI